MNRVSATRRPANVQPLNILLPGSHDSTALHCVCAQDACFQIDWSKNPADASEAIKTLKKAKQLAKNTETGSAKNTEMGSSIDRLITAFENLKQESVGIVYTNPSINRQDSSIRP